VPGELRIAHDGADGRIVVVDSVTHCDARVGAADVVVAGSFAGAISLAFVLERGARALIAHEAGPGKDGAGVAGLAAAERIGVPAAAVATMSARLGDGASVLADGVIAHANAPARALGVANGMPAGAAARLLLAAPAGGHVETGVIDRGQHVVLETPRGRVVLVGSTSFATAANHRDVICAGSHGGRVNTRPLLAVKPRGAITNDGGMARDGSGADGLAVLDAVEVAGATVDARSARIGDPASLWETGVISALNASAARAGVRPGQAAREAARLMLGA
jgi:hypothetical protein